MIKVDVEVEVYIVLVAIQLRFTCLYSLIQRLYQSEAPAWFMTRFSNAVDHVDTVAFGSHK